MLAAGWACSATIPICEQRAGFLEAVFWTEQTDIRPVTTTGATTDLFCHTESEYTRHKGNYLGTHIVIIIQNYLLLYMVGQRPPQTLMYDWYDHMASSLGCSFFGPACIFFTCLVTKTYNLQTIRPTLFIASKPIVFVIVFRSFPYISLNLGLHFSTAISIPVGPNVVTCFWHCHLLW